MPSISHALALYDTAHTIDRLRFQLNSLSPRSALSGIREVSSRVSNVNAIIAEVSDQVDRHLGTLMSGPLGADTRRTVVAYSTVLGTLGEAVTEMGRVQAEVALFNFSDQRSSDGDSDLDDRRQRSSEIISSCLEAAGEILESAAAALKGAAAELAPSPTRAGAARTRSPHASLSPQPDRAPSGAGVSTDVAAPVPVPVRLSSPPPQSARSR